MVLNNVPHDYSVISSGLGQLRPGFLLLVPIKMDELKIGVIELASFRAVEKLKISLVEKVASSLTSVVSIMKANEVAIKAGEATKLQNEEMRAAEEEMKQNMEEMKAVQEDLHRQMEENRKIAQEFEIERVFLNAIMETIPDFVYFKNAEGKFIRISSSMLSYLKASRPEDVIGKTTVELNPGSNVMEILKMEQEIMKSGEGVAGHIEHIKRKDKTEQWITVTRIPIYNKEGICLGLFGLSRDITAEKKLSDLGKKK